jgi:hypothetical protein
VHIPVGRNAMFNEATEAPKCTDGPSPRVSRLRPDQLLPEAARAVRTHAPAGANGGPYRAPHLGVAICHAGLRAASRSGSVRRSGSGSLPSDRRLASASNSPSVRRRRA